MSERKLFVQHIRTIPTIDIRYWSFALSGMVRTPLILSYEELLGYPVESQSNTIVCTSGHDLFGYARWHGVGLQTLLNKVEIDPAARYATAYSADGYSATYPLDLLRWSTLVTHMNNEPLPPEHGYPARIVVHGAAGYKMPKWVNRIDLTAEPVLGFWEQRGASLQGDLPSIAALRSAQIRVDGNIILSGEANTSLIHIRIDGEAWIPLRADEIIYASDQLTYWQTVWTPPYAGDFQIEVRAADNATPAATIIRIPPELLA